MVYLNEYLFYNLNKLKGIKSIVWIKCIIIEFLKKVYIYVEL